GMASFYDVSISDSSYCTYMSGDSYTFVNSRFVNCGQTRFTLYTLNGTFLSTLIANMGSDLYLYRVHDSIFHNLLMVNSGSWKIFHNTSTNLIFSNVAVNTAIDLYDGDNWKFTNALLLGSDTTCNYTGPGTNYGLQSGTCLNQGISDATHYAGLNFNNSFYGKVGSDSLNPFDLSAPVDFAQISATNFLELFDKALAFESLFRTWGRDASAWHDSSSRAPCSTNGQLCSVYDWRLKKTDMVLRNTSHDGINQNSAFVAGTPCPPAVDGNRALTNSHAISTSTFLLNSVEILEDDIGDEDGLCESNEDCLYSPNFGPYQGEGDYFSNGTCIFQNGTVSNVSMYAYPINGI
ncbi:MAG: hypothetical protein KDD35_11790, partial [Bdellovibrionales bacterium]|nr:hypothetical protein [Bdellovibrionales bacterium]